MLEEDRQGSHNGWSYKVDASEEEVPTLKCKQSFECSSHAPRTVDKNARFIPPPFLVRHMPSVTKRNRDTQRTEPARNCLEDAW